MGAVIDIRTARRRRPLRLPVELVEQAYTGLMVLGIICWFFLRLVFGR